MTRVVLRGFFARKLRALLTGIAIALGVTLMAGTYVLTDTINESFASIFSAANKGNDVVVTPRQVLGRNVRSQVSPITDATLRRVRATPGVGQAAGTIFSEGTFLKADNTRISTQAPSFITAPQPKRFESFHVVRGAFPATASQVAIDQATATRQGFTLGDRMKVAGSAPAKAYTIVGIVKFGTGNSFGGAGAALLTLPEAQRVVGEVGQFDSIAVAAAPGTSAAALRARLRAVLPAKLTVRTGAQEAAQQTSDIKANLGFLRTFLLVFAYVSLFVGAFIIFNTFSITVAQRTREFGLLRALGARRAQIMRSVIGESLLLGLVGSGAGVVLGIALAPALNALFKSFGADLPNNGTVLEARTIYVSLLVGTIVTLLAGLAPALRATRVPPIAALREGVPLPPGRFARFALPVSVAVLALGIAMVVVGLVGGGGALLLGLGALIVFVGVALVSPRIVPFLAENIGRPLTRRGITGRLAQQNAKRQPGRTAVTASALMIGVALVAFVSIFAAGTKASIDRAVDASFAGNLIVQNSSGGGDVGIPAAVAPALRRVPGIREVTPVSFTRGRVAGVGDVQVTAIDPSSFPAVYKLDWKQGSRATLAQLGTTGTVLTKNYADGHDLKVGRRLVVRTPSDRRVTLRVVGIASDNARLLADLTISRALAQAAFGQRDDAVDFAAFTPGATNAQVQPAVVRVLKAQFPQAKAQTAAEFKKAQAAQVNTILALISVLLALAVIVSIFGIVNTLVLSVFERTRELGMMRAIGTSRKQIRRMIRYESIITALIGGVLGLVVGIVFAVVITRPLAKDGFVLSIPVVSLLLLLVAAAAAGRWAAILPARRAAKLDVLQALAAE